jgi:uncharacterized protein (TIGR02145 family)
LSLSQTCSDLSKKVYNSNKKLALKYIKMKKFRFVISLSLITALVTSAFVREARKQSATANEVTIGNQIWMTQNLNVDKFRNGDPIPHAKTIEEWIKAGINKQPAWCYYKNDPANEAVTGKLYNWYAVNDPRGLAPEGWHIPTQVEWAELIEYLGGTGNAGNKLKSTSGWKTNEYSTNKSGFTALPGGMRLSQGGWSSEGGVNGTWAQWWSKTQSSVLNSYTLTLNEGNGAIGEGVISHNKTCGLSVRCLKDYSKTLTTNNNQLNESSSKTSDLDNSSTRYNQVTIGNQIWMTQNLNVDKFRNGDPVPHAKTNEEWIKAGINKQPAWCYYKNDPANEAITGKLYNWYAVNDPRGLAPEGWHIPTQVEWAELIEYLGGTFNAGNKLKNTIGWSTNEYSTNKSGFTALPGGMRLSQGGWSSGGGVNGSWGHWWSKTKSSDYNSYTRSLNSGDGSIGERGVSHNTSGLSVRCLKDYSKTSTPNNNELNESSSNTSDLNKSSTSYNQVTIGNQIWMTQNLNVDKFRNGNPVPQAKSQKEWVEASEKGRPAWCYYAFDSDYGEKYGKLYNWYAVNDPRGLAPQGWHIPKNKEWTILADYLGGEAAAGPKMKSTNDWKDGGNGTNSSGFSGIPGGECRDYGACTGIGGKGIWWSSLENNKYSAVIRVLTYNSTVCLFTKNGTKGNGFSVRCLKDE